MVFHSNALKEQLLESRVKLLEIQQEQKTLESNLTIGEELMHIIKQKDVRKKLILVGICLLLGISDVIILLIKTIS